jgi:hypothetical protein
MHYRFLCALLGSLALAHFLTGCSGSDGAGNLAALVGPSYDRQICVSSRKASQWIVGVATAINMSGKPLTLTSAQLTHRHGVVMAGLDLILLEPTDRVDSFGVWNGYPPRVPTRERTLTSVWTDRIPAVGATVPASSADTLNFVAHLTGDPESSSGPLKVTYRDEDGQSGSWTSNVTYAIKDRC